MNGWQFLHNEGAAKASLNYFNRDKRVYRLVSFEIKRPDFSFHSVLELR